MLTGIIVVMMDGTEEAFSAATPSEWCVDMLPEGRLIVRYYADKTSEQTQAVQYLPHEWRSWRKFKSEKTIAEAA